MLLYYIILDKLIMSNEIVSEIASCANEQNFNDENLILSNIFYHKINEKEYSFSPIIKAPNKII